MQYVNFALNMTMEMVASLLIMMSLERVGRKRTVLAAFLLCGVACIAPFFVSKYNREFWRCTTLKILSFEWFCRSEMITYRKQA